MQALGGIIVSVLNVITLAASGTNQTSDDDNTAATDDNTDSASVYNAALMFFSCSMGIIALCFGRHHAMLLSIG